MLFVEMNPILIAINKTHPNYNLPETVLYSLIVNGSTGICGLLFCVIVLL